MKFSKTEEGLMFLAMGITIIIMFIKIVYYCG